MDSLPRERVLVMYGNLCEAALRERSGSLLVIYHVVQTMQCAGKPTGIEKAAIVDELASLGIFHSRAYVCELLERGNGTFWGLGAGRVWLHGIARIAQALGARPANPHRQFVSTRELQTRSARRGALLGVTLPANRPIRQHTIQAQTGVSPRTQRRYRHAGSFSARRQDADVTVASPASETWMRPIWMHEFSEYGVYMARGRLMKRIPNSYTPKGVRLRRGRRSKEMFATQPLSIAEGDRAVPRVFFERLAAWTRCRRLKLGRPEAEDLGRPFNFAYSRTGDDRWEAIVC